MRIRQLEHGIRFAERAVEVQRDTVRPKICRRALGRVSANDLARYSTFPPIGHGKHELNVFVELESGSSERQRAGDAEVAHDRELIAVLRLNVTGNARGVPRGTPAIERRNGGQPLVTFGRHRPRLAALAPHLEPRPEGSAEQHVFEQLEPFALLVVDFAVGTEDPTRD